MAAGLTGLSLRRALLGAALLAALPMGAMAEPVWVGRFPSEGNTLPTPWKVEQFDERIAPTRYTLRQWDGVAAVEAQAKKSMALLARPLNIDLQKTPILCWKWRIDAVIASADMTQKSGDDYTARVYLSFAIPPDQLAFGTRMKLKLGRAIFGHQVPDAALNYVWDNKHPIGAVQDSAYTDRARLFVLRSGNGEAGAWVQEQRNVPQDLRRAFGEDEAKFAKLSGLAIATDTDNTGEEAHAGFADFRFVANAAECAEPTNAKPSK